MKKMQMFIYLCLGITLLGQDFGDFAPIHKELLLRDLELAKQGLDKFHTGMYTYTSKEAVAAAFDQASRSIDRDMNVLKFHKIIAPLIELSKEDHTNISLPADISERLLKEATYIPLLVVFLGDDLYCFKNGSNQEINIVGKKILSINNQTPRELVDTLGSLFASDGYITEVKKSDLRGFQFAKYYYLYYGNKTQFKIEFEDANHTVAGLKRKEIIKNLKNRYTSISIKKDKECLDFKIIQDSIAYLGIHDFDNEAIRSNRINKSLRSFLRKSFREIETKGTLHLILDISENTGGNEGNENLVYSYLGDQYQKYVSVRAKTQKAILDNRIDAPIVLKTFPLIERFIAYKRLTDGSYERLKKAGIGLYAYKREPLYKYKHNLYVLISPVTYSGGSELASMLYTNHRGLFFGQETGGGYYGNTSGYIRTLTLPHSKLQIEIPSLKFEMNVEKTLPEGRGVIPHHEIIQTFDEYASGKNILLEKAIEHITSQ